MDVRRHPQLDQRDALFQIRRRDPLSRSNSSADGFFGGATSAQTYVRAIGGELASDIRFLAELSLYGKFFVLPEYQFFRRFHQTSSSWNRTDMTRQEAYYAPRGSGFRFHDWRRYAALVQAVMRAPIGPKERLLVVKYLGGLVTRQRGRLFREIARMGKPDPRGLSIR